MLGSLLVIGLVSTGTPVATAVPVLATTETQLTTSGDRADPAISGDVVLYKDTSTTRPRIYWYDLATRSENLAAEGPASYSVHNAQITLLDDSSVTTISTLDHSVTRLNLPSPSSDWPSELPPVSDTSWPSAIPSRSFSDYVLGGGLLAWTCSDWYYDGRAVWAAASRDLVIYEAEGYGPDRTGYQSGTFAYDLDSGTTYDLDSARNPRGEGGFVCYEDVASGVRSLRHLPSGRAFEMPIGASYDIDVIDATRGRIVHTKGGDIYLTEFALHYPDAHVPASKVSFGNVYTGESQRRSVSIQNLGTAPLTVTGITTDGADGLSMTLPILPSTVAPGGSIGVELVYAPTVGGTLVSDLAIATDDPDEPALVVPMSGRALAVDVQASELVQLARASVANGTLAGTGKGRMASRNARSFLGRLVKAEAHIARQQPRKALAQLRVAYMKCDGSRRPNDLVTGPARAEVAARTQALIDRLQAGLP